MNSREFLNFNLSILATMKLSCLGLVTVLQPKLELLISQGIFITEKETQSIDMKMDKLRET